MWDEEEDHATPRYLLWICVGLGLVIAVLSAGGIIRALTEPDTSGFTAAFLVLLVFMAFVLVSVPIRLLGDTPTKPNEH